MNWQTITTEPNELGESPFWHPLERRLYWVDIPARMILRSDAHGGATQRWPMPSEPGCIAPAVRGGLVIALRDGIYRADDWGGALRLLHRFSYDTATTRFNDGKADPLGRFWAGTMFEPRTAALAELYVLDARDASALQVRRMAGDAVIANGLGWSPDQRTVYWADTPNHVIRAWDWDALGNVMQHPRVFQRFAAKPADWQPGMPGYGGRPDGAALDTQGNYYVAMFEGGRVLKFAPSGTLLEEIAVPVRCPTMPCFGGDDLRTLYLTTARHGRAPAELEQMPLSGCVFSRPVEVPGLPVNFFRD